MIVNRVESIPYWGSPYSQTIAPLSIEKARDKERVAQHTQAVLPIVSCWRPTQRFKGPREREVSFTKVRNTSKIIKTHLFVPCVFQLANFVKDLLKLVPSTCRLPCLRRYVYQAHDVGPEFDLLLCLCDFSMVMRCFIFF